MTDLAITRGDNETLTILVTDPDNNDTPINLTGATLTWMVKRRPTDDDDDAILTKATGSGITLANQTTDTGEATIAIDDTDTDALAPGTFYWELQSVDSATKVYTLAGGRIRIAADLIRET
jgi:hypothetical protein